MGGNNGLKVLVVDDSESFAERMTELVGRGKGYDVRTATTIEKAKKLLSGTQRFDAIITDLVLDSSHRRGGIEVIDEVRRSLSKDAPIVVYSGFASEFRKDLAELGVTVISKAESPFFLLDIVGRQIELAQTRNKIDAQATLRVDEIRQFISEEIARLAPIKARTIEVPGEASFELIKPLQGFKQDIELQLGRFPYENNVFLMMKFRSDNRDLADFIIETLRGHGFNAVRADDNDWRITSNVYNPLAVLYCCKYGIALFDEPDPGQAYSPNVAYELAIMHYQGKECLILRRSSLPAVPFDLIKDLYESYDKDLQVRKLVEQWAERIVRTRS